MADTIDRAEVTSSWQSLNTLVGIAVGDEINGQVVQGFGVRLYVGASAPSSTIEGFEFEHNKWFQVEAGSNEAWIVKMDVGTGRSVPEPTYIVAEGA